MLFPASSANCRAAVRVFASVGLDARLACLLVFVMSEKRGVITPCPTGVSFRLSRLHRTHAHELVPSHRLVPGMCLPSVDIFPSPMLVMVLVPADTTFSTMTVGSPVACVPPRSRLSNPPRSRMSRS